MLLRSAALILLPLPSLGAVVPVNLSEELWTTEGVGQVPLSREFTPVPVTLGVMSQCPDAHLCERVFDDVIKEVGYDIIDLKLQFVAKLDDSQAHYGVSCLHGPLECAGAVHELCAAEHSGDARKWWPFVQCLNSKGRYNIGKLEVSKSCADVTGLRWKKNGIEECVQGDEGVDLLKKNVRETKELEIAKSCTMMINHRVRCVHDGEWKECHDGHAVHDFARMIREEFKQLNPDSESM